MKKIVLDNSMWPEWGGRGWSTQFIFNAIINKLFKVKCYINFCKFKPGFLEVEISKTLFCIQYFYDRL